MQRLHDTPLFRARKFIMRPRPSPPVAEPGKFPPPGGCFGRIPDPAGRGKGGKPGGGQKAGRPSQGPRLFVFRWRGGRPKAPSRYPQRRPGRPAGRPAVLGCANRQGGRRHGCRLFPLAEFLRSKNSEGGKRQGCRFPPAQGIGAEFPAPGGGGELERIARFFAAPPQKMRPTYPRYGMCSKTGHRRSTRSQRA
jgi:hypothetical protein